MSITRLQQARQMYAMGQRVGGIMGSNAGSMLVTPTRDGSRPGYYGPDAGHENDPGHGSNAPGGGDNDYNFRGPSDLGVTTRTVDTISPPDVNRSAVSPFSTYGINRFNQTLKGPSVFSQIGTGIKDYITGGGLIGAGIRGLTGLVDRFTGPKAVDYNDGYNMANIAGPVVGPTPTEGGDGGNLQGIMATYTPNMLDTAEEDVTGGGMDASMSDFLQRFRGLNETRQDKLGQLDPQIIAMINKLYTTPTV